MPPAPTESPTGAGFHHPPAAALQGVQAPVQIRGINFGLPTTASPDVTPMESVEMSTDAAASMGAEPTPVSAVHSASAAHSPVQVNGFFFGVPSGASDTQTAAPAQTFPAQPDSPVRGLLARQASLQSPAGELAPASLAPATPAQPVLQQQQQPGTDSSIASGKSEQKKDLSIAGLLKLRTGFGLEGLLAAVDSMEELESPAAQSASVAAAAQPATANSAPTGSDQVSVTIARAGAGVTAPVVAPAGTTLAEFLQEYSQFIRQPFNILRVAHNGEAVDRGQWGLSFGQLSWGLHIMLEVDFTATTATSPHGQSPVSDTTKAAVAVPADSNTDLSPGTGTVHLTVNREGREPVVGPVPTTAKLGALLAYWASERGLSLEALQVFFKGTVVDKSYWESTFAELGCGSSLVLDTQVQPQQAASTEAGAPQQHDPQEERRSDGEILTMIYTISNAGFRAFSVCIAYTAYQRLPSSPHAW